jgi:hypothetical protein
VQHPQRAVTSVQTSRIEQRFGRGSCGLQRARTRQDVGSTEIGTHDGRRDADFVWRAVRDQPSAIEHCDP